MRSLIFIILFLYTIFELKAQLYIKPILGYGYDVFSNYMSISNYRSMATDTITTFKSQNSKISNGIKFGCSFGKDISKNIDFELGLYYFRGFNTLMSETEFTYWNSFYKSLDYSNIRLFVVNPSVYYSSEINNKLSSYLKLGFLIGTGRINYKSNRIYPDNKIYTSYSNGNYFIGFNSAFGFMLKLNNRISLFNELEFNSLNYTPLYSTEKKHEKNNDNLNQNSATKEFVNEYSIPDGAFRNNKEPKRTLKFNNISFNFGIKYNIQETKTEENKSKLELTTGASLISSYYDSRVLKYKYSESNFNTLLDINVLYSFNKLYIGIGGKGFFNTKNYKNTTAEKILVKLNSLNVAYVQCEYDVVNKNKYSLAPNFRAGYFDIVSNNWTLNTDADRFYYEFGINNKIKLNNNQLIIRPSISYMTLSYTYFISYGLNIGIRY